MSDVTCASDRAIPLTDGLMGYAKQYWMNDCVICFCSREGEGGEGEGGRLGRRACLGRVRERRRRTPPPPNISHTAALHGGFEYTCNFAV